VTLSQYVRGVGQPEPHGVSARWGTTCGADDAQRRKGCRCHSSHVLPAPDFYVAGLMIPGAGFGRQWFIEREFRFFMYALARVVSMHPSFLQ
jgi:hypothetical protein